jgi:hypothetical protein
VLFPVRFLWTLHTGLAGANADAARWYAVEHRGAHATLVEATGRYDWRRPGRPRRARAARHLPAALQREFLAAYRTWLSGRGRTAQAARFGRYRAGARAMSGQRGDQPSATRAWSRCR